MVFCLFEDGLEREKEERQKVIQKREREIPNPFELVLSEVSGQIFWREVFLDTTQLKKKKKSIQKPTIPSPPLLSHLPSNWVIQNPGVGPPPLTPPTSPPPSLLPPPLLSLPFFSSFSSLCGEGEGWVRPGGRVFSFSGAGWW